MSVTWLSELGDKAMEGRGRRFVMAEHDFINSEGHFREFDVPFQSPPFCSHEQSLRVLLSSFPFWLASELAGTLLSVSPKELSAHYLIN